MKTDIFHLQIIPLADILVHEEYDQSRTLPLIERLKYDSFIANPIIVASIGEGKYLQLDGVNRYTAFKRLGLSSILAQIINYIARDVMPKSPTPCDIDLLFAEHPETNLMIVFSLFDMRKFRVYEEPTIYFE